MLSTAVIAKIKKILAIAIDYDGCYCYLENGMIVDHADFHEYILDLINQDNYDEVILLVGSLRQSRDIDVYCHTAWYTNGSITLSLPHLLKFLQANLKIPVSINEWLVEDVIMEFKEPEQFRKHKTFVESKQDKNSPKLKFDLPRHLCCYSAGSKEASEQFNIEEKKAPIILFHTHLLGKIPNSRIDLLFIDDYALDIYRDFRGINAFETLIPDNVTLQFVEYETGLTPSLIGSVINGRGKNYLDIIKTAITEQVKNHKNLKTIVSITKESIVTALRAATFQAYRSNTSNTNSLVLLNGQTSQAPMVALSGSSVQDDTFKEKDEQHEQDDEELQYTSICSIL